MQIAFLGTGLMGAPMALQLHRAGHEVTAWNRTAARVAPLGEQGLAVAESPLAALERARCAVLMLADARAIEETLLAAGVKPVLAGRTVLQMGTIGPGESQAIAAQVEAAGGEYLEAPVLGSIPEAKAGRLLVMVGATAEQFQQWLPVLECFGPEPQWVGPVGTGSALKLAMNQLIGTLTAAFSMSLALVRREGLEVEKFMAILRQSALYAPTFDKKLGRMCAGNFANPNFPTKHLLKDLDLFVQAAQARGIEARVADSVGQVVRQAIGRGLGEADYSAIFSAIDGGD